MQNQELKGYFLKKKNTWKRNSKHLIVLGKYLIEIYFLQFFWFFFKDFMKN